MRDGTAIHMALHEPERFRFTYVTVPSMPLRSKADKQAFLDATVGSLLGLEIEANGEKADDLRERVAREFRNLGSVVLPEDSHATLLAMVRSLNRPCHSYPRGIIARGKKEVEIRWIDSETGLKCKAMIDSWDQQVGILSDVKRTDAITEFAFRRQVLSKMYHIQMAFYRRALRSIGEEPRYVCFTCGCPTGPVFPWAVYGLTSEVLDATDRRISEKMVELARCLEKNEWPSLNGSEPKDLQINPEYV
jgi:hypothetical protein